MPHAIAAGPGADPERVGGLRGGSLNFGQGICCSRTPAKKQERGPQDIFSNADALRLRGISYNYFESTPKKVHVRDRDTAYL